MPKSGTLVARHTERVLLEVLDLLETYRQALRASKPRDRDAVDQEVQTRYYRMHANIAQDLEKLLPRLVSPGSWQTELNLEARGSILKVSSEPVLRGHQGTIQNEADGSQSHLLAVTQAVLIIRQTRKAHEQFAHVIRRIEQGDPPPATASGEGGGGGAGGGFGGGFFSTR